ncbi:MAG: porin, partial [Candidatus Anammoxibacter sp.]
HMPLDMGYDNGFFLKTHDEKFSLSTNGMFQFRYIFEDDDRNDDSSSFRIRRGRLIFNGNAFNEHMKYFTQMELRSTGSKDGSKSVELLDFFGTYEKYEFAKIRFGQWKVPFNSQFMTSAGALQMIDRSEVDDEFNLGRQLGVAVFGELLDDKLGYYLGAWNGNFRNEKGNDNNQHLWIARAEYMPFGHFGHVESDYEYSEKPLVFLAGAVAFDNEEGKSLELRGIGELETNDIDKTQIVGELGFKYKGFSFEGEYYWRKRHIDTFSGSFVEEGEVKEKGLNDSNLIDRGFFAQAGYFLIPRKLEMTGRYSLVSFDDQLEVDSIIETTLGLNYYFAGRRNKLQFNAVRLDEDSHDDGKDAIDYKYLLQYQLTF